MNLLCGRWMRNGGSAAGGLDGMLAALPAHESAVDATWARGPVALGCRRGATVREERAERLPRLDPDAGLAIAASARLDGRGALCEALDVPRAHRTDLPDGDLILLAYRRWGPECPAHLLGDFAFVVWDASEERLFCARDHVGARPFYYSSGPGGPVFASTVDAVLAAPGVSAEIDERTAAAWLADRVTLLGTTRTFFRAVRRLAPGHALVVERAAERIVRWWRPEESPPAAPARDDEYAEAFRELYTEVVRDCVRTVHPVGVHLSGGLDSSSVAVLAARELRRQGRPAPLAFTWHPPPPPGRPLRTEAEDLEHGLIEAVGAQEGLAIHHCPPSRDDVVAHLRHDVTRGASEPTLVHEQPVQRCAARQGVRVLLSGWGGDEGVSFNGRGHLAQLLLSGRFGTLRREVREYSRHPLAHILARVALPLVSTRSLRMASKLRRGRWPWRRSFIHPAFARRAGTPARNEFTPVGVRPFQLFLLGRGGLSQRIEGWAESAARRGIEYRYPLLDRRVLRFALGLPPEQYRRGRWSRWMMRNALDPVLPRQVCWNPDKRDPVRSEALRTAEAEALAMVRRLLDARDAPPSRSVCVDLPRVLAALDRPPAPPGGGYGALMDALRYLDW